MTAVEWLFDNLDLSGGSEAIDTIKKALEIERKQQEYFFNCGRQYQLTGEGIFTKVYNETFKK